MRKSINLWIPCTGTLVSSGGVLKGDTKNLIIVRYCFKKCFNFSKNGNIGTGTVPLMVILGNIPSMLLLLGWPRQKSTVNNLSILNIGTV